MDSYTEVFKSICRVCLSHSSYQDMVCLFDTSNADGLSNHGKFMVNFAHIKLDSKDNLPTMICKNCLTLLNQAVMFKDKCENSDFQLKTLKRNMRENGSRDDYKKIICEYTIFKHYFPEECLPTASLSNSKDSKPVKARFNNSNENIKKQIKSELLTQITSNSQMKQGDSNSNSNQNSTNDMSDTSDTYSETKYHETPDQSEALFEYLEKLVSNTDMNNMTDMFSVQRRKMFKKHVKKNDYTCTICDKQLKRRMTYDRHMQRHNGCRYMCEGCAKAFPTIAELNVHQVAAHGIGPHLKCDHCPFKAARKITLIEHIRLHTGERPYTCEKCGLTFRRKAIYRNHLVYHDEKTVQCLHCPKMFYRRSAMVTHMNNIHDRLYVYVCGKCGITYTKNITVRRHLTEKHGIPREMQGKIEKIRKGSVWPVK